MSKRTGVKPGRKLSALEKLIGPRPPSVVALSKLVPEVASWVAQAEIVAAAMTGSVPMKIDVSEIAVQQQGWDRDDVDVNVKFVMSAKTYGALIHPHDEATWVAFGYALAVAMGRLGARLQ